jgi:hypothetical protein
MAEGDAAADEASHGIGDKFDEAGGKVGGIFSKLGNTMANFGLPFSKNVTEMGSKFDGLETKGQKFSSAMGAAGGAIAAVGAAAVVGIAAEGIHLAMNFQQTEAGIAAAAGISTKAADKIGSAFLHTAGTTIYSGQEIATAFQGVAGELGTTQGKALSAAQAMTVMHAAMDLAEGSGQSLSSSTSALAGVMQSFGIKASGAAGASDILFTASEKTGQSTSTLAAALEKTKTKLGSLAPPLGQMGGLLVDMTTHGETGRAAMSAFTTSFTAMLAPTTAAVKAQQNLKIATADLPPALQSLARSYQSGTMTGTQLTAATNAMSTSQTALWSSFTSANSASETARETQQKLGVTMTNSQGKFVGMTSVISQLHNQIKGMGTAEATAKLSADGFGSSAAKLLTTIQAGPKAYNQETAAVTRAGSAHAAAQKQAQTLSHEFELVKASAEDIVTEFGQFLLPKLEVVGAFIAKHTIIVKALAVAIGVVLGSAVTVFAVQKVSSFIKGTQQMISSFSQMVTKVISGSAATEVAEEGVATTSEETGAATTAAFGPIGLAIGALVIIAFELYKHWRGVWTGIKTVALDAWHFLDNILHNQIVKDILYVVFPLLYLGTHWRMIWGDIKLVINDAWNFIKSHIDLIAGILLGPLGFAIAYVATHWSQTWGTIKSVAHTVWNFVDSNVVRPIVSFFTGTWHAAVTGAGAVWSTVWTGIKTAVQDVWKVIGPIIGEIAGAVSKITGIISKIGGIAGGAVHAVGGLIHHLAGGGLVSSPTIAYIGEAGPELVLNQQQTAMVMAGGSVGPNPMHFSGASGGSSSGSNSPVYIEVKAVVNGREFANAMSPDMRAALLRGGRSTITVGLT